MSVSDQNGWEEHRLLVKETFARHELMLQDLSDKIDLMRTQDIPAIRVETAREISRIMSELSALRSAARTWGAVAGGLLGILGGVLTAILNHALR